MEASAGCCNPTRGSQRNFTFWPLPSRELQGPWLESELISPRNSPGGEGRGRHGPAVPSSPEAHSAHPGCRSPSPGRPTWGVTASRTWVSVWVSVHQDKCIAVLLLGTSDRLDKLEADPTPGTGISWGASPHFPLISPQDWGGGSQAAWPMAGTRMLGARLGLDAGQRALQGMK